MCVCTRWLKIPSVGMKTTTGAQCPVPKSSGCPSTSKTISMFHLCWWQEQCWPNTLASLRLPFPTGSCCLACFSLGSWQSAVAKRPGCESKLPWSISSSLPSVSPCKSLTGTSQKYPFKCYSSVLMLPSCMFP